LGPQPLGFDFHWVSQRADNRRKRLGRGTMTDVDVRSLSKSVPRFQLEATGEIGPTSIPCQLRALDGDGEEFREAAAWQRSLANSGSVEFEDDETSRFELDYSNITSFMLQYEREQGRSNSGTV
jgi:hypothetical protein